VEELHGDSTVGLEPHPKIWARGQKWKKLCQRWRAGKAQMRDNPGGELDPAEGVRRRCKNNSPSVLSCIVKRTREGGERGSEVGAVHSG